MGNVDSLCVTAEAEMLATFVKSGQSDQVMDLLTRHPELLTCKRSLAKGFSVWHAAAKAGTLSVLSALAEFARSDLVFVGLSAEQRKEKLKHFLDLKNSKGMTALMIACSAGHADCAAFLVEMGANLFCTNGENGITAVHIAARDGHADCIHAILTTMSPEQAHRGAIKVYDACTISGLAPLHFAVTNAHVACVEALLEYDAYLTPKSKHVTTKLNGCTPLHYAAMKNRTEEAVAILRYQVNRVSRAARGVVADIRLVRDADGWTPYQIARNKGQSPALCKLLHPNTDLCSTLDLLDLALQDPALPKLSALAAGALQRKLALDIQQASEGSSAVLKCKLGGEGSSHAEEPCAQPQPEAEARGAKPSNAPSLFMPVVSDWDANARSANFKPSPVASSADIYQLCAVCFDHAPDLAVGGCKHRLCTSCARKMCSLIVDKPLACPFCRRSVGTFSSVHELPPSSQC